MIKNDIEEDKIEYNNENSDETIYIDPLKTYKEITPPSPIKKKKTKLKKKKIKPIKKPKIPDFSTWTEDEIMAQKSKMLYKLERLKKQFPNFKIPDLNLEDNIEKFYAIVHTYDRNISIESKVQKYKLFLYAIFAVTEYVTTSLIQINTSGFTSNQIKIMKQYEHLLYEIAEKNISSRGSSSPEFRLLIIIGLNSIIFIVVRALFGSLGPKGIEGIQNTAMELIGEETSGSTFNIGTLLNAFMGGSSNSFEREDHVIYDE